MILNDVSHQRHNQRARGMTQQEKWAEYRRIRDAIFSACWDCPSPCADCCEWSRARAFGREPTTYLAQECAETYEAVMEMQRRGTSILIGLHTRRADQERLAGDAMRLPVRKE